MVDDVRGGRRQGIDGGVVGDLGSELGLGSVVAEFGDVAWSWWFGGRVVVG